MVGTDHTHQFKHLDQLPNRKTENELQASSNSTMKLKLTRLFNYQNEKIASRCKTNKFGEIVEFFIISSMWDLANSTHQNNPSCKNSVVNSRNF